MLKNGVASQRIGVGKVALQRLHANEGFGIVTRATCNTEDGTNDRQITSIILQSNKAT